MQFLKKKEHTCGDCQGNIETHSVLKINEEHTKHTNMQKKEYTHMCAHTPLVDAEITWKKIC